MKINMEVVHCSKEGWRGLSNRHLRNHMIPMHQAITN